ncbi:MAG: family 20 glycosylhydrolase [Bacteroidales bacterium]|nr:family 20 glycosylhydrolase [Bacteroidales bacterium]
MTVKHAFIAAIMALGITSCQKQSQLADYQIVPLPKQIELTNGTNFVLNKMTVITYPKSEGELLNEANFLAGYINDMTGFKPVVKVSDNEMQNAINLKINKSKFDRENAYNIIVGMNSINITGTDAASIFYGIQTLRKSMSHVEDGYELEFPTCKIYDHPRFDYRGMHLDVSRHFFPIENVKTYIDIMAMHNLNKFHFHITDDQGWRMEIKKYPELTEVGAWRSGTIIGKTMAYDSIRHGGFYTQDELRDLVRYAADRHITIIPEIDLPGHMLGALATYPEFGCTGGPYEVWQHWGVSEDVICAGNEDAMKFLEDVLEEVMDVFPSEYIHIGGDECPRVRWEKCPKCQKKIKELGIKGDKKHTAEDYLQSYVMSRMEKFIESHGRHIIGWDEMLDGELAPNATVMSWRSSEGGYKAAKMHHNVIMTPNDYLYFDYYQTLDSDNEPFSIGGYNPVQKVYSYEPIPEGLDEDEAKYILGPQANIWTEYTSDFNVLLYRMLPRIGALAEVQWCNQEQKDWKDFVKREFRLSKLYDFYHWNYATHIFDISTDIVPNVSEGVIEITMSKMVDGEIRYTVNGENPATDGILYTEPLKINQSCNFKTIVIRDDGTTGKMFETNFDFSKASMKPITLKKQPDKNYTFDGANVLIDGLRGTSNYRSGRWLGFFGENIDATIDLMEETEISKVKFNNNINMNDWIFNAKSVRVLVSSDGKSFSEVSRKDFKMLPKDYDQPIHAVEVEFPAAKARYVEVIIKPFDCPKGHSGYGYPAWVFVDEIGIY